MPGPRPAAEPTLVPKFVVEHGPRPELGPAVAKQSVAEASGTKACFASAAIASAASVEAAVSAQIGLLGSNKLPISQLALFTSGEAVECTAAAVRSSGLGIVGCSCC